MNDVISRQQHDEFACRMQDGRKRTIHRLKEERDGEMWRKVNGYVITAVIRIVTGYVLKLIGM
ncbi:hypothetical protein H1A12_14705 [Sellimonas intestinalis]|nr:hypothetical protein [Sellimonas intestinalis]